MGVRLDLNRSRCNSIDLLEFGYDVCNTVNCNPLYSEGFPICELNLLRHSLLEVVYDYVDGEVITAYHVLLCIPLAVLKSPGPREVWRGVILHPTSAHLGFWSGLFSSSFGLALKSPASMTVSRSVEVSLTSSDIHVMSSPWALLVGWM